MADGPAAAKHRVVANDKPQADEQIEHSPPLSACSKPGAILLPAPSLSLDDEPVYRKTTIACERARMGQSTAAAVPSSSGG
jgi:hypothetical protein